MPTIKCPAPCGVTNKIPAVLNKRVRCGKCKREFTPHELVKAEPDPPEAFTLPQELDDMPCPECGAEAGEECSPTCGEDNDDEEEDY